MLLTDAVNIKDAFIVNVGLKYEIITLPNYVSRDVLLACNTVLIDYFNNNTSELTISFCPKNFSILV